MTRPASFDTAMIACRSRLMPYAMRLTKNAADAEDLVQDTFVKAMTNYDLFEPGTAIFPWLCTILRNRHLDRMRLTETRTTSADVDGEAAATMATGPRQYFAILLTQTVDALNEIHPGYSEAVVQCGIMGEKHTELADRVHVPLGTVKTRVARGREALAARGLGCS